MIIWLCDKNMLQKEFADDVESILEPSIDTWYVTSGFRSLDEQSILYAKYLRGGAKAAPPGKSAHNYHLACDVVPDGDISKPGLQMMWDIIKKVVGLPSTNPAPWLWLRDAVKKHPRLHSGWSFQDWPHIEKVNWRDYK